MTASTASSSTITNAKATPVTYSGTGQNGDGKVRTYIGTAEVATTSIDEAADVFLLCSLRGNQRVLSIEISNDDLDSNCTPALAVDVGLYKDVSADGTSATEVDVDAYASAITTLQAAAKNTEVANEARDISKIGQTVADDGGESAHNSERQLGLTVTTAAATAVAGTISWVVTVVEA